MDTIKDYIASFFAGLQDRATNPLTTSIAISWALWNYKFFLIVFGSESTPAKLALLSEIYSNPKEKAMEGLLLYPVLAALAYVFLYPWISRYAVHFYRRQQIITANIIKQAEGERVLSQDDAAKLIRKHEAQRNIWKKVKFEIEQEVDQLRDALAQAEEKIESTDVLGKFQQPSLSESRITPIQMVDKKEGTEDDQSIEENGQDELLMIFSSLSENRKIGKDGQRLIARILIKLSEYSTSLSTETIATNLSKNLSIILIQLEEMQKIGLVHSVKYGNTDAQWALTPKGRQLAVLLLEQSNS